MEMFLLQQLEFFSLWRLSLQPADRQGVVLAAGRCRAVGAVALPRRRHRPSCAIVDAFANPRVMEADCLKDR